MNTCKVCGNTAHNKTFIVREMMFGLRDEFEYLECASCGCLQIKQIPADIPKYYPDDYYSYQTKGEDHLIQEGLGKTFKRNFKKRLLDYHLSGDNFIGKLVTSKYTSYYPWLKKKVINSRSAILDVGCGSGELLLRMYNDGFKNLTGADPYIKDDIHYKCGVIIHKKSLNELKGKFDLIMLHHAFEHMDQPAEVLKSLNRLLTDKGQIIIRIPVAGSYAWKTYGTDWVQLDAPRHFFLHTEKSMHLLAEKAGLKLTDVMYDSWELQFTGSEKYKKNIPLNEKDSLFTETQIEEYKKNAAALNATKEGDQAVFYLSKK